MLEAGAINYDNFLSWLIDVFPGEAWDDNLIPYYSQILTNKKKTSLTSAFGRDSIGIIGNEGESGETEVKI